MLVKRTLVINKCGSVGKSAVSAVFLMPRLGGHLFSVETSNEDASIYGAKVRRYDPRHFQEYLDDLVRAPGNTVTDVGGTNFLTFVNELYQTGAVALFDYVIVVVDRSQKGQTEGIVTIKTLLDAGLDRSRLRVLLNKAEQPNKVNTIAMQYKYLLPLAEMEGIKVDLNLYLPERRLFPAMVDAGKSWADLMADTTDYNAMLAASASTDKAEERIEIVNKMTLQNMARQVAVEHDKLFAALRIGPAQSHGTDLSQTVTTD